MTQEPAAQRLDKDLGGRSPGGRAAPAGRKCGARAEVRRAEVAAWGA